MRSHPSASSLSRSGPSGPFTMRCPTCPSVPAVTSRRRHRPTCHTSAPSRVRAPGPVSGQLYGRPPAEEPVETGRAFLLPFGRRPLLLGHPVPPREFGPPYGRLTTSPRLRGEADPGEVSMFRTYETRLGRVPSGLRGRRCSRDRSVVLGRRLPPLNGAVPATPVSLPVPGPDND